MLEHKNFIDIKAFQTKFADCFEVGDIIQISEKLDGSNASFQYDPNTESLVCFSRKMILDPHNTLDGFYGYINNLEASSFNMFPQLRFFGEWNLKHLVKYEPEQIKQFHCFDIYDTKKLEWLPQDVVVDICEMLNLKMVPVFYWGPFVSWEHVQHFIGHTSFGLAHGEGVVVKNQTRLNDPNDYRPFVVKLVGTKYLETAARKIKEPLSMDEIAKRQYENELTDTIVTEARVEKIMYKAIMNGELSSDWDSEDMGLIARTIPTQVYHDCAKEEPEIVNKVENFGKLCSSHTMTIIKEMLKTR